MNLLPLKLFKNQPFLKFKTVLMDRICYTTRNFYMQMQNKQNIYLIPCRRIQRSKSPSRVIQSLFKREKLKGRVRSRLIVMTDGRKPKSEGKNVLRPICKFGQMFFES